ncbi:MAG: hypothetical protein ABSE89_11360 [Sedimentisphaerales bacterium]
MKTKINSKSQVNPALRFTPYAWAKLLYFRDKGDTEIGGFGITETDDLLLITDFLTVKQNVTSVSVSFDDNAVADFFDQQVDSGKKPEQFARYWLHTHPGNLSEPSLTDEQTFKRVFGNCDWAVMFILAEDDSVYARLSFNTGPKAEILLPVKVDFSKEFRQIDLAGWYNEFKENINQVMLVTSNLAKQPGICDFDESILPAEWLDEFARMTPAEKQFILDELAAKPELWNDESEVICL